MLGFLNCAFETVFEFQNQTESKFGNLNAKGIRKKIKEKGKVGSGPKPTPQPSLPTPAWPTRCRVSRCAGRWGPEGSLTTRSGPTVAVVFPSAPFWLGWWWGGVPSLRDTSRRLLTRRASLIISRQSAARWRLLGCTRHVSPM
jgi:hypothetical protein